jgi:transcription antitermination protein NusB
MAARHRSRQRALQVLYQWDMTKQPVEQAIFSFYDTLYSDENESGGDSDDRPGRDEFMEELAKGTSEMAADIDHRISSKSENWRLERMPTVDRNILRMAIYEMSRDETPAAVVIDEALELARQFSGEESVSFINGILDAVHKQNPEARSQKSEGGTE